MAQIQDKIVKTRNLPSNTNVTWVDTSTSNPVYKVFINGKWTSISGEGGKGNYAAYHPAGNATLATLGSLDASHEGFSYNMTADFTTTSDFVEGSGITYPAGSNVAIVNVGTIKSPTYKYDVLGGTDENTTPKIVIVSDITTITSATLETLRAGDVVLEQSTNSKGYYAVMHRTDNPTTGRSNINLARAEKYNYITVTYSKLDGVWGTGSKTITPHATIQSNQMQDNGLSPNVVYNLGELTEDTTFIMAAVTDISLANVYHWTFETGSTVPSITWPSVTWCDSVNTETVNGVIVPTIESNKYYEIRIMNGYGTIISANIQ